MRWCAVAVLWLAEMCPLATGAPAPDSVAVLYNSAVPESKKLAEFYRSVRGIPAENLIALQMPDTQIVSRADYDSSIAVPLRKEFDRRGWWTRGKNAAGFMAPTSNKIRILVTVRGVPLSIRETPKSAGSQNPPGTSDQASVDSELAMFGVEGEPLAGGLPNRYFNAGKSISGPDLPFLVLTARIDAPTYATCERIIRDAIETEQTGLWGMAYVDIANKFPQGDQWLETVVTETVKAGIPTVVDRFNETFANHYPMRRAAFYFGWYDRNVNGPFLSPGFRFRKGAVAMHLHSFSAEQLRDVSKNWSGALLEKGAAVTIGNVFEPYLHLTHDFGALQKRLLEGYSWVEACWMAMPVASWQGVVLGDPLYQPFKHLDGSGVLMEGDNDFRALRAAALRWEKDPSEWRKQLDKAADRTHSGVMAEAAGLGFLRLGMTAEAVVRFHLAKDFYTADVDKLRQDFHVIAIDRAAKRKDLAIRGLKEAQTRYGAIPEAECLKGWLDLLDPPPPPPAGSAKNPAAKTSAAPVPNPL